MGKRRREKNQKILEKNRKKKNEETKVPWADLPQEILGIILGKLVSAMDVIRLRAVCKSWHIIDDIPKDHRKYLPWLCNLDWSNDFLECQMYDPYSRQIFKTWKFVESRRYTKSYSKNIRCLGSKQGWLIAAYHNNFIKWEIFMYNPYTKDFISLPFIWKYHPCFATFSGNPVSQNCRVFLFLNDYDGDYHDYIASYGLNGEKEWEIESLGVGLYDDDDDEGLFNGCCGMQYMNEQLFCLFENGRMIRYNLADKFWTSINLGEGSHQLAMDNQRLWLAKGEGDILVVCELDVDGSECWTFYFDWSSMSWVGSDLQETSAVFISGGDIATFVRPFEDYDDVENDKGCKVYFFDEYVRKKEPSGYSFAEMRKRGKHSFSTAFMEPPRISQTPVSFKVM